MQSNVAILGGEACLVHGDQSFGVIPLKNGEKTVLSWKIKKLEGEIWFDFVERSIKETLGIISDANLEKKVTAQIRNKIWYHFEFKEE